MRLVPGKRGSHLALSLERLQHLVGRPIQRIGLSATQRPLEEVARYLGGAETSRKVEAPKEKAKHKGSKRDSTEAATSEAIPSRDRSG